MTDYPFTQGPTARFVDLTQDDLDRIVQGLAMYADWQQEKAGEPSSDDRVDEYVREEESARALAERLTMAPRSGWVLTIRDDSEH